MKKLSAVFSLIALTLGLCSATFAATQYVVATLNNPKGNRANIYKLNTASGTLSRIAALSTGGFGLPNPLSADVSNTQQAVTQNAACVFVFDIGSSDIAAFSKSTGYAKVGNYSHSVLDSTYDGGSLALTPDGKFLYASYSATGNIGAWAVNSDCSLSFVASYIPSGGMENPAALDSLKVTPNGNALISVVPSAEPGAEMYSIDHSNGNLNDLGFLPLQTICSDDDCSLSGIDITRDSKFVIFGGNEFGNGDTSFPGAFTAQITPKGLTKLRAWPFFADELENNSVPFLSEAAFSGAGNLYFGAQGAGGIPGVVTTSFTEHPFKITVSSITALAYPDAVGAIGVTSNLMVAARCSQSGDPANSAIEVYSINADDSLTLLSTTTVSNPTSDLFSLTLFPNTR